MKRKFQSDFGETDAIQNDPFVLQSKVTRDDRYFVCFLFIFTENHVFKTATAFFTFVSIVDQIVESKPNLTVDEFITFVFASAFLATKYEDSDTLDLVEFYGEICKFNLQKYNLPTFAALKEKHVSIVTDAKVKMNKRHIHHLIHYYFRQKYRDGIYNSIVTFSLLVTVLTSEISYQYTPFVVCFACEKMALFYQNSPKGPGRDNKTITECFEQIRSKHDEPIQIVIKNPDFKCVLKNIKKLIDEEK